MFSPAPPAVKCRIEVDGQMVDTYVDKETG